MYNSSASVKLPKSMLGAIKDLRASTGLGQSELFREIMSWAVNLPMIVPEQKSRYRFRKKTNRSEIRSPEKSVCFQFGAKITSSLKQKILNLCDQYDTDESHFFRFALAQYIIANKASAKVKFKPAQKSQITIPRDIRFLKPTFSSAPKFIHAPTFLGKIQESNLRAYYDAQGIANLVGVLILLSFTPKN